MLNAFSWQSNAQGSLLSQDNTGIAGYKNANATPANIILTLSKTPEGNALLTWTAEPGTYEIIRTDEFGQSDTILPGPVLTYTDTITSPYCAKTGTILSYIIQIKDLAGSASNLATGSFFDSTLPIDPLLDSISVDLLGHPVISWTASISNDVGGYEIQKRYPNGQWLPIGMVPANQTSFTADSIDACTGVKTFTVLTIDKCGYKSPGSYPDALNTILIDQPLVDECKGTALLSWNPYRNMKPAFGEYHIYRNEDGGMFSWIGTSTTSENATSYTDKKGFTKGVRYGYYVRVVNDDATKTSTSCERSFTSDRALRPDKPTINTVSVINSQDVAISIRYGPLAAVKILRVFRSETASGNFEIIDSLPPGKALDVVIPDITAKVNERSYYYRIEAVDNCGVAISSDTSRTMYLTCQPNSDESNSLSWNAYEGWPGGVDYYEVSRIVNGLADPANPITSIPSGTTTYTDPPSVSQQGGDIISYYVTAFGANASGTVQSISNTVKVLRAPMVLMPNAFRPRGPLNNRFGPKMKFVGEGNFQFLIFNKWGQQMFISDDKNTEGWDGTYKGEYAPSGIYFYRLEYSSASGDSLLKNGALVLIE